MKNIRTFAEFLNEAATTSWSQLVKSAKKGKAPYSLVVIDTKQNYPKGKVVKQEIDIKTYELLPAYYEELRRQFPNALIHLEDGEGSRLWSK